MFQQIYVASYQRVDVQAGGLDGDGVGVENMELKHRRRRLLRLLRLLLRLLFESLWLALVLSWVLVRVLIREEH